MPTRSLEEEPEIAVTASEYPSLRVLIPELVRDLTPSERRAFSYRFVEDATVGHVMSRTRWSKAYYKKLIWRIRRKLHGRMEEFLR